MAKNKIAWCHKAMLPVPFGFCPNKKTWDKEMKRRKIKEPYPKSDARCTFFEGNKTTSKFILVAIPNTEYDKNDNLVEITGLLVHESLHVLQFQKEVMGEDSHPIEYDAYILQYIFQSLYSEYLRTRQ